MRIKDDQANDLCHTPSYPDGLPETVDPVKAGG